MRPDWPEYFMEIANKVAQRATCPRASIGAVIVKNKRILTTGYNGAPAGLPHCDDEGCIIRGNHCIRIIHAEQNAINQAALFGVSTRDAEIYITMAPCFDCAKAIINAGIVKIWYQPSEYYKPDPANLTWSFLKQAGVEAERIK